jgi:hypothetical protein
VKGGDENGDELALLNLLFYLTLFQRKFQSPAGTGLDVVTSSSSLPSRAVACHFERLPVISSASEKSFTRWIETFPSKRGY